MVSSKENKLVIGSKKLVGFARAHKGRTCTWRGGAGRNGILVVKDAIPRPGQEYISNPV